MRTKRKIILSCLSLLLIIPAIVYLLSLIIPTASVKGESISRKATVETSLSPTPTIYLTKENEALVTTDKSKTSPSTQPTATQPVVNGSESSSTTPTSQNANTQSTGQNTSTNNPEASNTADSSVSSPSNPKPTVLFVVHPGSGGAPVYSSSGDVQPVFVTPTPHLGAFEASFTYEEGLGKVLSNKPLKVCQGKQKAPNISGEVQLQISSINGHTRWGCPDGKCNYICEIYYAPPNTPRYDWPYGAKVVSEQGEEKTFGDW